MLRRMPLRTALRAWCILPTQRRHIVLAPVDPRNAFAGHRPRARLGQRGLAGRLRAAADEGGSGVSGGDGARGESEYSQAEWDAALRMCAELLQVRPMGCGCGWGRKGVRCEAVGARVVTPTGGSCVNAECEWRCVGEVQEATVEANKETRKELLAAYKTEAIDSLNNGASCFVRHLRNGN